jgi:hypothetical protein
MGFLLYGVQRDRRRISSEENAFPNRSKKEYLRAAAIADIRFLYKIENFAKSMSYLKLLF